MNLKKVYLKEKSQCQKSIYYMIPFVESSKNKENKSVVLEIKAVVASGDGGDWLWEEAEENFLGAMEVFRVLIGVWDTWAHVFIKSLNDSD